MEAVGAGGASEVTSGGNVLEAMRLTAGREPRAEKKDTRQGTRGANARPGVWKQVPESMCERPGGI